MSAILHLIRTHVFRRRVRTEASVNEDGLAPSRQAIRSRRYRMILASVLTLIGVVTFVEVVLLPGSLIRKNLPGKSAVASMSQDGAPPVHPLNFLMSDQEKERRRQEEQARIEKGLRGAHQKLGNACVALSSARDSLTEYSNLKLHVVPRAHDATVAPALVDVLANEPTASVAWSKVLEVSDRAEKELKDAREKLEIVGERFAATSFLPEDEHDMSATVEKLDATRLALDEAHNFIDHINTLRRARAALAHQASLDTKTGAQK